MNRSSAGHIPIEFSAASLLLYIPGPSNRSPPATFKSKKASISETWQGFGAGRSPGADDFRHHSPPFSVRRRFLNSLPRITWIFGDIYLDLLERGVLAGGPLVVGWGFQPGDPFEGVGVYIIYLTFLGSRQGVGPSPPKRVRGLFPKPVKGARIRR